MISIEHVHLVVSDLENALRFYQAAFPHWRVRTEGQGEWNGKPRKWLHFGDDYHYLALSNHGEGENRDLEGHQVGLAHISFNVQNLQALIERLDRAGFKHRKLGDDWAIHRKNIYYLDADGFEIEFVEYFSDLPTERNM